MELKLVLESILFSSQKPLSVAELRTCLNEAPAHAEESLPKEIQDAKPRAIEKSLETLAQEYQDLGRSFRLTCVAGSWQFVNAPDFAPWIKALYGHRPRAPRLTQAALETLAIVAYRQPLTRAEAEQIRGVSIDGVLKMLIDRGLVEQAGRSEAVGKPMTFRTTELFLEHFGLNKVEDLPAADELRRVPVEQPDASDSEDEASEEEEEASDEAEDETIIEDEGEEDEFDDDDEDSEDEEDEFDDEDDEEEWDDDDEEDEETLDS